MLSNEKYKRIFLGLVFFYKETFTQFCDLFSLFNNLMGKM
jgi:hypothetical protein